MQTDMYFCILYSVCISTHIGQLAYTVYVINIGNNVTILVRSVTSEEINLSTQYGSAGVAP